MSHEVMSKTLISVLGFFITISLMVMGWVGITTAENNVAISNLGTQLNIEIPRLITEMALIKNNTGANSKDILIINQAKLPSIESKLQNHLQEHKFNEYERKYGKTKDIRSSERPIGDSKDR